MVMTSINSKVERIHSEKGSISDANKHEYIEKCNSLLAKNGEGVFGGVLVPKD